MKKVIAFAFVACMISFAACTSKPAEEAVEETVEMVEETVDSVATDVAETVDSLATEAAN